MIQSIVAAFVAVFITLAVNGCGGGAKTDTAATQTGTTDSVQAEVEDTTGVLDATRYRSEHDPDRTYALSDITMRGSYLKLNLEEISAPVLDRVVHRLRTESCTCGCEKDTIDECLINDPNCETAVTLANQVLREEKIRG